jgi:hypothetical protein
MEIRRGAVLKIWPRTCSITFLVALLAAAASPQNPAAKLRVAPAQVVEQVRVYRIGNEDRIVREIAEFLAIYNVTSDTPNIQKNPARLVDMLEASWL